VAAYSIYLQLPLLIPHLKSVSSIRNPMTRHAVVKEIQINVANPSVSRAPFPYWFKKELHFAEFFLRS
jgi:hypothetical protein